MRVIVQKDFGGPAVLELTDGPVPSPLPSEVLVRVRATGVHSFESAVRSGAFPLLGDPPFTLGWDFSGVVEHVVPGVTRFKEGDEVYGMPFFPRQAAAYAEYLVAPSRQIALKPRSLSHLQAAAMPLAALTAWQGLVDGAGVTAGQRVLVHAAGGGVGHFAVQIAKALGAHVVATCGTDKQEFVRGLGADEVIDYSKTDFARSVREIDVVFEAVGGDYADRSLRTLRDGGLLVTIVERADAALAARAEAAGRRFMGVTVEPDHVALERLAELADSGLLRPHVEHVFPLEKAAEAQALASLGHTKGRIVLSL
ncbi:NADP-dependent oxidoreductase [Nonomuraea sp. NPDC050556]|uniref:NADP-dependent oxidoreductase n=1 Tax=Nonomuraea sp. NPDC050556 TaxID=3364369 RepID=UPI00378D29D9